MIDKKIVILLLSLGIIFRLIFANLIPPFTGNDEPAHLRHTQHIKVEKTLPNSNLYQNENLAGNEYFQPPLYYTMLAPLISLAPDPIHQLRIGRLFSILLWVITFYFAYKILIVIKLPQLQSIIALSLISLLPYYIFNSSSITNDSLLVTLSTCVTFYIIDLLDKKISLTKICTLSILVSLTILTKLTGFIFIPASILLLYYKQNKISRKFISITSVFLSLVILLTAWWFIYNFSVYNDPAGPIKASTAVFNHVPQSIYKYFLIARGTLFTFWAAYGPANEIRLPQISYIFLSVLTLLSIAGFFLLLINRDAKPVVNRKMLNLLITVITTNIALHIFFNINQHQPLGRYLFASIVPLGICFALGLNQATPKKIRKYLPGFIIILLLFLNILGANTLIHYYY